MDTIMEGPGRTSRKTAIQRSGGSGTLILPWTKQILCVLWEHLRLLLQVVYYSFVAVFQMFRLEVHLRITDETGHHVSASGSPAESFIISSLFDGNGSVFIPGASSLSKRGGSHAGALLSGLRAEDLCLSLVDDFVIRAKEGLSDSDNDVDLCLGHHPAWARKDPGDWEVRVVDESERAEEVCCYDGKPEEVAEAIAVSEPAVEQEESFWDEEEEDGGAGEEFNSEESQALWESFMRSSDPYNPLSFSACISTSCREEGGLDEGASSDSSERDSVDSSVEEGTRSKLFRTHRLDLGRRGSESETSDWDSSSDSGAEEEGEEEEEGENERLWELFANPADPYNPFRFTACAASARPAAVGVRAVSPTRVPSGSDTGEGDSDRPASSGSEEEELWNSFSQSADPYHPLHFRACLQSSRVARDGAGLWALQKSPRASRPKPRLPKRHVKRHRCLQTPRGPVPWRKPEGNPATGLQAEEEKPALKKVRFSPVVQVHVMVTWSFAHQAVRKGPWEEIARDRARFQRRIQETEQAIGYCLHQSHREKILDYLRHRQNTPLVLEP
ncbi:hypothetical protein AAFF_G00015250 [Aldrovandia affinis]|uniref:Protein phosphatase 1 regulatory subunit 15A/B C-terminal domain-containing protein n=1 Tax=Aldrovandia affinis TaxID=143900 RepID=A0AAD7WH06_9TELE|nr:hypothetical protein AAFF_G00015250 [Aldrovandia affinis]